MILIAGARWCFCSLWPPSERKKAHAQSKQQTSTQRIDTIWGFSTAHIIRTAALLVSSLESRRQRTGKENKTANRRTHINGGPRTLSEASRPADKKQIRPNTAAINFYAAYQSKASNKQRPY